MQTSGGVKALVALLVLSSAGSGTYAYVTHRKLGATSADLSQKLDECAKARDDETSAREASEKSAAAASSDLSATHAELDELRHQKQDADQRRIVQG